jgi:hypothetical protein
VLKALLLGNGFEESLNSSSSKNKNAAAFSSQYSFLVGIVFMVQMIR